MSEELKEHAATVLVIDPLDRVYLSRRLGTPYYQAPGGKKEKGEFLEETAARELQEETGLDREPTLFHRLESTSVLTGKTMVLLTFMAYFTWEELENMERTEPEKNGAWIPFSREYALANLNLLPGLRAALEAWGGLDERP